MTFDDGILALYEIRETQEPGEEPRDSLVLYDRSFFAYDTLGIQRYYTALQAGQQIEAVVDIPGWHEIQAQHFIAVITHPDGSVDDTCTQYRIQMVQPTLDNDRLRITKLSLERVRDNYADFS